MPSYRNARDRRSSARRPIAGARRPDAAADPRASKDHGAVGGRACPGARPKPAARVSPSEDPGRCRRAGASQGRQLGVPDARRCGAGRADVRPGRYMVRRFDAGAVRVGCRANRNHPRRARRGGEPLFHRPRRGLGPDPLAARGRKRSGASDRPRAGQTAARWTLAPAPGG